MALRSACLRVGALEMMNNPIEEVNIMPEITAA